MSPEEMDRFAKHLHESYMQGRRHMKEVILVGLEFEKAKWLESCDVDAALAVSRCIDEVTKVQ